MQDMGGFMPLIAILMRSCGGCPNSGSGLPWQAFGAATLAIPVDRERTSDGKSGSRQGLPG